MRVIVVANHKGGVGKTTLTGHLAVQAGLIGDGPVAVLDLDPQGSLADWANAREDEAPVFLNPAQHGGLANTIAKARKTGFKTILVDTPPSKSNDLAQVLSLASIVLIPIQASPHDLRAVGATIGLVTEAKRPLIFCINRVQPRARLTSQAVIALSQHGTLAPVMIGNRTDFAASMTGGSTVQEAAPASPGAKEVADLWTYIRERIVTHGYEAAHTA
jgi:chromosome partitioning protein